MATQFTTSKDGTRIAYDKAGRGAPLVLVWGALAVADAIPGAKRASLPRQNHGVKPASLVPALKEFCR